MKNNHVSPIIHCLLAVFLLVATVAQTQAGPGPHETYLPVTTMKEAEQIKPGDRIAIRCGKCGAVSTMIADQDRSYLHGYTCDTCKAKFTLKSFPGTHGAVSAFVYEDDAGNQSTLLRVN